MHSYGFMDVWLEPPEKYNRWWNREPWLQGDPSGRAGKWIAILIPMLQNVKTLYISVPEEATPLATGLRIGRVTTNLLSCLETLYIYSSFEPIVSLYSPLRVESKPIDNETRI